MSTQFEDKVREELREVGFWDERSPIEEAHLEQTVNRLLVVALDEQVALLERLRSSARTYLTPIGLVEIDAVKLQDIDTELAAIKRQREEGSL